MPTIRTLLPVVLLAALVSRAPAQDAGGNQQRQADNLVIQVYDISDLFVAAPDYPLPQEQAGWSLPSIPQPAGGGGAGGMGGGGFGGGGLGGGFLQVPAGAGDAGGFGGGDLGGGGLGGGGGASVPATGARPSVEDLIRVITRLIEPESWSTVGGPADIQVIGQSLVVRQSAAAHRQIEALLGQLRHQWGPTRTVTTVVHWVFLSPAELAALLANGSNDEQGARRGNAAAARRAAETRGAPVNEKKLELLLASAEPGRAWRGEITCFNQQTVHLVSGRRVTILSGLIPLIGSGSIGFTPVINPLQEGATLQLTPAIMPEAGAVVLNLQSRVLEVGDVEPIASPPHAPGLPGGVSNDPTKESIAVRSADEDGLPDPSKAASRGGVFFAERADQTTQNFATTLRVPAGRPVLVGGMTFEPSPGSDDPRQLYLIVQATVNE